MAGGLIAAVAMEFNVYAQAGGRGAGHAAGAGSNLGGTLRALL